MLLLKNGTEAAVLGRLAVFWQVDVKGRIRTGKIMLYDPKTGHRVKEPHSYVCWVHSELKLS